MLGFLIAHFFGSGQRGGAIYIVQLTMKSLINAISALFMIAAGFVAGIMFTLNIYPVYRDDSTPTSLTFSNPEYIMMFVLCVALALCLRVCAINWKSRKDLNN